MRKSLAGPALYALTCVLAALVLAASGMSDYLVRAVGSIGGSHAIRSGASTGPQNILLMGLESRTDWNGRVLPERILRKLHAGSRRGVLYGGVGGNDTNTLILIHIPAGGKRAVGFSIPRDDLVRFADTVGPQQQGKIDQAYGVSMYYQEGKLRQQDPHLSQNRLAYLGNEAGRAAAVATVERLTGVHIDHFAEVNLAGFYELAKVFGGVQVCLKHPVSDRYSGAHFKAGYQHLDAQQALAFVRQRHGLPNGDLDRTHRQQAFIDSIIYQLRTEGILSDLGKLQALLAVAKRYVITDSGWNLLDFATQMKSLTSGHMVFRTLPIERYGTWGSPPQDVNIINPSYIKRLVHAAFYPAPRAGHAVSHANRQTPRGAGRITVDVYNGTNTYHLAADVAAALVRAGYVRGQVGNTAYRTSTAVLYGSGAAASGRVLARMFKVTAAPGPGVAAGQVHILLGAGAAVPNIAPASQQSPPAPSPSASGPQGGVVTAGKYGIPCVD